MHLALLFTIVIMLLLCHACLFPVLLFMFFPLLTNDRDPLHVNAGVPSPFSISFVSGCSSHLCCGQPSVITLVLLSEHCLASDLPQERSCFQSAPALLRFLSPIWHLVSLFPSYALLSSTYLTARFWGIIIALCRGVVLLILVPSRRFRVYSGISYGISGAHTDNSFWNLDFTESEPAF